MWFIKYTENERLLFSASFMAKYELVLVLTQGNGFFRDFILKPTAIAKVPLIHGSRDYKITLRLRDWHVSLRQSFKILNFFNTLKRKHFSKKLEYRIWVECTKIVSTTFLHKTTLLEPKNNPIQDRGGGGGGAKRLPLPVFLI